MTKLQTLITLIVLFCSLITLPSYYSKEDSLVSYKSSDQYEKGFRFNIQGWIYVHIEGDPYERGYQHGYLLSEEIEDMLHRWSHIIHNYPMLSSITTHLSKEKYEKVAMLWWEFCTTRIYQLYWDKFPSEYQSEIQGIAEGAAAKSITVLGREVTVKDILAINEMYEFMSKLTQIPKGIHPLRTFIHQLEKVVPESSEIKSTNFIERFLSQEPAHHCNGFIASGNATTHGQMVVTHSTICGGSMWWWTYYISLRWNVLLDIQPLQGHRILMPTSPGLIWSDEDYYQNDAGIVLLETTVPQGLFDNKGLPLSVRARYALQYGNCIDDVIYHLKYRNDGCMNAVWLIGDAKTGEISRFELGYRKYAVWRTYNGYYWSANNPFDTGVRLEKFTIRKYVEKILHKIIGIPGFGYHSIFYRPESRDLVYDALGEKYYGEIDVDVVKKIAMTSPISDWITDIKITDSSLLADNGMWAFFGNPYKTLNSTNFDTNVITTNQVFPCGWVRLFGLPDKDDFSLKTKTTNISQNTALLWKYETEDNINYFSSSGTTNKDMYYVTTSQGMLYCLEGYSGSKKWSTYIGENPTGPCIDYDCMFIGHSSGVSIFDLNGNLYHELPVEGVTSLTAADDMLFVGDKDGILHSFSLDDYSKQWSLSFPGAIYLSPSHDQYLYVTSNQSCFSVNLSNHKLQWQFQSNGVITSPPSLVEGTIYCGSWDSFLYALNAKTGEIQWSYEAGWGYDVSPVISNNLVFVGSLDNNFYALHINNGSLAWIFSCKAGIHSNPCIYGEYIFFGADDGRVYAIKSSTGDLIWTFKPCNTIDDDKYNYITTPILSDSLVHKGMLYIGVNGTVYAVDTQMNDYDDTSETINNDSQKTSDDTSSDTEKNDENLNSSFLDTNLLLFILIALILVVIFTFLFLKKRNL
jgi:outer membrane protein assembly factor BamB